MLSLGNSLKQLPAAIQAYEAMQSGDAPVPKGNVVLAYSFTPGQAPGAILQVFYNVGHSGAPSPSDESLIWIYNVQGITPPSRFLAPFKGIASDANGLGVRSYTELVDITSKIFYNEKNLR